MEDLLDLMPCGFLRLAESGGGAILRTNATFLAMLGYAAGELEGLGVDAFLSTEARSFWQTDFLPLLALRGEADGIYLSLLDKQGETVPVLVNAVRRETDGEAFIDCIFVRRKPRDHDSAIEITERRRAEEALHQMERHYRALAVASSEIAYRMSADWSTLLPLDGRRLVASSDQPLADWAWLDQNLPPEEHPRVRQAISDAIAGKTLFELEHRVRRSDGSIGWTLSRAVPILDENEEVTAWFGAASDITVRKQAEEALRENAAVFSTLIAQAPMGTYVIDEQFRMRQINAHAMPAFGSVHPLIGRDFQEVVEILWGPEVGGPILRVFRNTLETGERYISPPFTEKRHDLGIEQTYEWETQRVTLPEGQHGVVCYFHEVTERAQAMEALRASQERMRLAAEATGVGIWEWNVVTNAIRWDALMFRINGIEPTPDGFVQYQDWSGAVLPEDLAENEAILQDTVRRAGQSSREFRIRRRSDGECRHIQAVETVRKNAAGQTEWVVGTNLDVTERNLAEKRLRASDERFRIAEDASLSFVYEWDVTTGRETRSEGFTKVLGYEADEFPYGGEAWEALIHPDDVPHVRKAMVEKPSSDGPSRVEYRLRRKDSEWRSVFDEFMRFWDRDGNLTRVVGSIVDISERKQQQQVIENLNVRLQRSVAESHHRIKNNLQVLSAMIELQSSGEDSEAKEKWGRLSNHIRSLASLHDILTLNTRVGDGDIDRVNVKFALEKMFQLLSNTMGNRRMSLDADETIFLPIKEVSSFSLLVNELVSNARKHGAGDIAVSLKREATNIKLEVCDDGPGFPVGFDPLRSANMGIELIESLSGWDLGGTVTYENRSEGGARVSVLFPSVTL